MKEGCNLETCTQTFQLALHVTKGRHLHIKYHVKIVQKGRPNSAVFGLSVRPEAIDLNPHSTMIV